MSNEIYSFNLLSKHRPPCTISPPLLPPPSYPPFPSFSPLPPSRHPQIQCHQLQRIRRPAKDQYTGRHRKTKDLVPQARNRIPPRHRLKPRCAASPIPTNSHVSKNLRVRVDSRVYKPDAPLPCGGAVLVYDGYDGAEGRRGGGGAEDEGEFPVDCYYVVCLWGRRGLVGGSWREGKAGREREGGLRRLQRRPERRGRCRSC